LLSEYNDIESHAAPQAHVLLHREAGAATWAMRQRPVGDWRKNQVLTVVDTVLPLPSDRRSALQLSGRGWGHQRL